MSCRVVPTSPPSLCTGGQLSPLAGLPAQGSCSSWTGLWPAQNKCSWGGSTPVIPPPDFSWPLTFGWLGQTLFSLPGCCMRSSDTLSSMPNLLVKPGLRVPCPFRQRHSPVQGAGRRWALGQLAPVSAGAGCHTAPWGFSEATLVASRLGSHIQHAGLGRRQRGPRWQTARRSDKAACKGLRSEAEQDHVWGPWSQGEEE